MDTTIFTEDTGHTWHILQRDGGSISLYATYPGDSCCYVAYDSLDGNRLNQKGLEVLARLVEIRVAITALEETFR